MKLVKEIIFQYLNPKAVFVESRTFNELGYLHFETQLSVQ